MGPRRAASLPSLRRGAAVLALCCAAGCANDLLVGYVGGGAPISLAPPDAGYQLTFGPYDVPSGHVQLCRTVRLDNEAPIAIGRIDVRMLPGSHRFVLFGARPRPDGRSPAYEDRLFDCAGPVNLDEWSFIVDVHASGGTDWRMLDGQAVVLPPRAQLLMQSAFTSSTVVTSPDGGYAVANLHQVALAPITQRLRGLRDENHRLAVPPDTLDWRSRKACTFSRTVYVAAMSGHSHSQGNTINVRRRDVASGELSASIYCSGPRCEDEAGRGYSWDKPLFKVFDPPLLVRGDDSGMLEGLEFECSFDNPTDDTLYSGGPVETQEHCNLFFAYARFDEAVPGDLTCVEE